jgi:hypothetical protein
VADSLIFGILAAEGSTVNGEAKQSAWVEKWAKRIEALGLSSVALVLIEIARPCGPLGSQALLMAQPLLTDLISDTAVERTTALLDSPKLLDQLRACLEGKES